MPGSTYPVELAGAPQKLDALYVLVVADIMLVRDPLLVPYMTIGVVASAVVHSTTIWL